MASTKVGSYVLQGSARPWLSAPPTVSQPKTRRTKPPPEIVNPIFEKCASCTADPYWVHLFSQAALGKMPRGFMFREGNITHKRGQRVQRLLVPENPTEALSACIEFFNKTANISSTLDIQKAKSNYDVCVKDTKSIHECDWSELKNATIRKMILSEYVHKLSIDFSLQTEEIRQLSSLIQIGFIQGRFQDEHVSFENGKIEGLDGLQFDEDTRFFSIDPDLPCKAVKSATRAKENTGPPKNSFYSQWSKYLEKTNKKRSAGKTIELIGEPDDSDDADSSEPATSRS